MNVCVSVLVLWESKRHAVLAEFPLHLNQYIKTAVRQQPHTHTHTILNQYQMQLSNLSQRRACKHNTYRSNALCRYSLTVITLCRWILPHSALLDTVFINARI